MVTSSTPRRCLSKRTEYGKYHFEADILYKDGTYEVNAVFTSKLMFNQFFAKNKQQIRWLCMDSFVFNSHSVRPLVMGTRYCNRYYWDAQRGWWTWFHAGPFSSEHDCTGKSRSESVTQMILDFDDFRDNFD